MSEVYFSLVLIAVVKGDGEDEVTAEVGELYAGIAAVNTGGEYWEGTGGESHGRGLGFFGEVDGHCSIDNTYI